MSVFDDPAAAYRLIAASVGAGILWISLRHVTTWRSYASDGIYPWRLHDERPATPRARLAALFLEHPGFTAILCLRALAAAWTCAASIAGPPGWAPVTLLLAATLVKKYRLRWTTEEAEVMNVMILFPLAFHVWRPEDSFVAAAGLWFISAQVCLAYLGAGLSKLWSKAWRRGVALTQILDSSMLRNPPLARAIAARPWLGRSLCWGTIGLELLLPLAPILPRPLLPVLLVAGAIFHLSIAVVLGLGSFMWAFLATYPALVFVNRQIAQALW